MAEAIQSYGHRLLAFYQSEALKLKDVLITQPTFSSSNFSMPGFPSPSYCSRIKKNIPQTVPRPAPKCKLGISTASILAGILLLMAWVFPHKTSPANRILFSRISIT